MDLKFAVAETCENDRCQVTLVDDGRSLTARYSAMMIGRMTIYPGQLVAIDMDTADPDPVIAWRWHRVRVIEVAPQAATLEDPRGRRSEAARLPELVPNLAPGDEVWITGFGPAIDKMEVHAKVVDNRPADLEQFKQVILPRVVERISSFSAK